MVAQSSSCAGAGAANETVDKAANAAIVALVNFILTGQIILVNAIFYNTGCKGQLRLMTNELD